jgi:hypothetical protein
VTRVWYCANCGYEVHSRGRCHACRERLTASALPELPSGEEEDEVGYRIDGWTDRDRGRLIVRLNDLGLEHRFEEDELVVDAADEERVDDLMAVLGETAEAALAEEEAGPGDDYELDDLDGSENGDGPAGPLDGESVVDEDDDLTAAVRLLADAAGRLRADPTDMQADADVAEASAAVFIADRYGPFDEEAWSAIGRSTRRLLSALGAEEALEEDIGREAGVLEKLLAPVTGAPVAPAIANGAGERTVYELADWLPDQRAELGIRLEQAGIPYEWEGEELLVPSEREDEVEEMFDRVASGSGGDDDGDERRYRAVAELFAACGRLAADPTDQARRDAVLAWIDASEGAPLLGMDDVDWFRIRSRCRVLMASIEEGQSADEVFRNANHLHDLLRTVV